MSLRAALRAVFLLALASLFGCQQQPSGPPPDVDVARVVQEEVPVRNEYTGRTEAFGKVELRARVAGTLREAHVTDGREVVPGELLFLIDPAPYQSAVDGALVQLQRSEGVLQRARDELERGRPRMEQGDMSESAWERRMAAVRDAELLVQGDADALHQAQAGLTDTRIMAPVAGVLHAAAAPAVGSPAGPGSGMLATITQLHPMAVRFELDRTDLLPAATPRDERARTLELTLEDGTVYPTPGRLELPEDAREGSATEARGLFPNVEGSLVPDMDVKIALIQAGKATRKLVVPQSAIREDWRGPYVLRVGQDNRLELRRITTGHQYGELRVVDSGLAAGDRVVASPTDPLESGVQIVPRPG